MTMNFVNTKISLIIASLLASTSLSYAVTSGDEPGPVALAARVRGAGADPRGTDFRAQFQRIKALPSELRCEILGDLLFQEACPQEIKLQALRALSQDLLSRDPTTPISIFGGRSNLTCEPVLLRFMKDERVPPQQRFCILEYFVNDIGEIGRVSQEMTQVLCQLFKREDIDFFERAPLLGKLLSKIEEDDIEITIPVDILVYFLEKLKRGGASSLPKLTRLLFSYAHESDEERVQSLLFDVFLMQTPKKLESLLESEHMRGWLRSYIEGGGSL